MNIRMTKAEHDALPERSMIRTYPLPGKFFRYSDGVCKAAFYQGSANWADFDWQHFGVKLVGESL